MKHAICIQCHNKPEIVNFWIDNFPAENFDFYIHVDKKSNIIEQIKKQSNVFFVNRIDVKWGQVSQVEATIKLLETAVKKTYLYIHLISGNDLLIKHPEDFVEFFNEHSGMEFIESNEIGPDKCTWSWGGADRYSVYYPLWMIRRPTDSFFRIVRVGYREFVMRTRVFKRRCQPVSGFYGGSQWFSITEGMAEWILSYLTEHQEYLKFFKHGVCVDEVFFQTLVRLSPYAKNVTNNHLRYMDWNNDELTSGPKELTIDDWEQIENSGMVFARKVTDLGIIKEMWNRGRSK